MGIYTAYDLRTVDAMVDNHMQTLKDLCVSELGSNLTSLVLSGSFGRGEGSVILHKNGSIEPLRDYDVRVIVNKPVQATHIDRIRQDFMSKTGLGSTSERFSGEQGFSLTLEPLTRKQFATTFVRDCDLRVYDHLNASRLIFGEDLSAALLFPASEIPKVNGLRFLYQKMIGLVGHYEAMRGGTDENSKRNLSYECNKTFIELCTALVLLAGQYVPSYKQRAELFERNWRAWFPELAQSLPNLSVQVSKATREKLMPSLLSMPLQEEEFSQARQALLVVHRFYIGKLYGVDVMPDSQGVARLRRLLLKEYFSIPVDNWLESKGLRKGTALYRPGKYALNIAYHRLLRLKFAQGAGLGKVKSALQMFRAEEAPPITIFISAWCALAAMGEGGVKRGSVSRTEKVLDRLPQAHMSNNMVYSLGERITQAYSIWERHR